MTGAAGAGLNWTGAAGAGLYCAGAAGDGLNGTGLLEPNGFGAAL